MRLCKTRLMTGEIKVGILAEEGIQLLFFGESSGIRTLSDILHSDDPSKTALASLSNDEQVPVPEVVLLPPLDQQEIWGAGVTYKRSREARERESVGAARFYDQVYSAQRPELFFK